jgi:hypothetical protein
MNHMGVIQRIRHPRLALGRLHSWRGRQYLAESGDLRRRNPPARHRLGAPFRSTAPHSQLQPLSVAHSPPLKRAECARPVPSGRATTTPRRDRVCATTPRARKQAQGSRPQRSVEMVILSLVCVNCQATNVVAAWPSRSPSLDRRPLQHKCLGCGSPLDWRGQPRPGRQMRITRL